MSLVGKILAILNLLGVAAFFYMATLDLGRQKTWKHANLMADFTIKGLPLDDKEVDKMGQPITENLNDEMLQKMFPQGNKVKTQVEEVKRVQSVVQTALEGSAAEKTKQMLTLAKILMPFATSNNEREDLLAVKFNLADDKKAEALKQALGKEAFHKGLTLMLPDGAKRSFEEAYTEAIHLAHGESKDVFVQALLRALPQQGGKKFKEAFLVAAQAGPGKDIEEVFLQQVRNQPGKPFEELYSAAYNQAIDAVRADMQQQLQLAFQEALLGKRRVREKDKAPRDADLLAPPQQKRAIASLLFNLVEVTPEQVAGEKQPAGLLTDDPAYKRVITVVGVGIMGKVIEAQAMNLQNIATELNLAMAREQAAFGLDHVRLFEHIRERARHLDAQIALLAPKKALADEREKIVAHRKEDVKYFTEELDNTRKDANDRLKEQDVMRAELYKIRLQVRDATRLNQEYERQINALEQRVR